MFKYIVAAVMAATPLAAENCAPTGDMLDGLAEKYGEHITAQGLSTTGNILSVLTNPETGSYSVLVSSTSGHSCLVDAGGAMDVNVLPVGEKM